MALVLVCGAFVLLRSRSESPAARHGVPSVAREARHEIDTSHRQPAAPKVYAEEKEGFSVTSESPSEFLGDFDDPTEAEPQNEMIESESEQDQIEEPASNPEPLATMLANTNLEAAIKWLSTVPDGEAKEAATRDIAYEASRKDPQTALDLAAGLPANAERDNLLDHAVSQFASSDARAATDWVLEVPGQSLRARLLTAVATAAAEEHPSQAATLVATSFEDGEEQKRAAVAVVQRWVQTAPKDAAAWVEQFPEGPIRHAAAENLLSIWSLNDRAAANAWLETLPEAERAELRAGS